MGVKSWAVKKATRALAKGIRAGGRFFHQLIGELDAKAATFFRKHSNRIADELESIATIPDLTLIIVTEKISYFMTNVLKANPGTAKVIEKTLEGLLWFLL